MSVRFASLQPDDVVELRLQPSQHFELGLYKVDFDRDDGRWLASIGQGWTARAVDGRILGCAGFADVWPGKHGIAWAMLGEKLGAAHVAITRFVRARIADSPLDRIEAIVRASEPECQWARLVGLELAAVLRRYGPTGETHMLYERVRP